MITVAARLVFRRNSGKKAGSSARMIEKRFSMHKTRGGGSDPLAQILTVLNGNGTNTGSSAGQTSTGSSA